MVRLTWVYFFFAAFQTIFDLHWMIFSVSGGKRINGVYVLGAKTKYEFLCGPPWFELCLLNVVLTILCNMQ